VELESSPGFDFYLVGPHPEAQAIVATENKVFGFCFYIPTVNESRFAVLAAIFPRTVTDRAIPPFEIVPTHTATS
jgi:hypothetical protein